MTAHCQLNDSKLMSKSPPPWQRFASVPKASPGLPSIANPKAIHRVNKYQPQCDKIQTNQFKQHRVDKKLDSARNDAYATHYWFDQMNSRTGDRASVAAEDLHAAVIHHAITPFNEIPI